MVGFFEYLMAPDWDPVASRALTTFRDCSSATSPKTTWRPSSQEVTTVVTKNWEPLLREMGVSDNVMEGGLEEKGTCFGRPCTRGTYVLGPALAMERRPGRVCFLEKFSSANFSP